MPQKTSLDLDKAVTEWAWRKYAARTSRKEKKLLEKENKCPKGYIGLKIDWDYVKFVDVTTWPRLADDRSEDPPSGGPNGTVPNQAVTLTDSKVYHGKPETSPLTASVLFQTKFTNNTNTPQASELV